MITACSMHKQGDQLTLNTTRRADINQGPTGSIPVKQTHLNDRWLDLVNVSDYERDSEISNPTTIDGSNEMATTRLESTANSNLNVNEKVGVNVLTDPDNMSVYVEGASVTNQAIDSMGEAVAKVNPKSSEVPECVDEFQKVTTYPSCTNEPVLCEPYGSHSGSHTTSHEIAQHMDSSNICADKKYGMSGLLAQADETTFLTDIANCSESGPQDRPHSGHSKLMDRDSMNLDQSEPSLAAPPTLTHAVDINSSLGGIHVKCQKVGMPVASEVQFRASGTKVSRESLFPNDDCKPKIYNTIVTSHPVPVRTHPDPLTTYSEPGTTHVEPATGHGGLRDVYKDLINRTEVDIVHESKTELTPKQNIYAPKSHDSINCVANVSDHSIASRQVCRSDETETINTGKGTRSKSKRRDKSIGPKDHERKPMKQTSEQGMPRQRTPGGSTVKKRVPDRYKARQEIPDRSNIRQQTPDRNKARKQTAYRSKGRPETSDRSNGRPETPDRSNGRPETPDRSKGRPETLIRNKPNRPKEKMEMATKIFTILELGGVRCVLAAGGVLNTILMPQHARVLTLNALPISSSKDTVAVFLSQFGMIEDVHVFKQTKAPRKGPVSWGEVTFVDHKSAACALEALAGGKSGYSVSSNVHQNKGMHIECRLYWCRRPLTGIGFVTFEDDDYAAIKAAYTSEVIVNDVRVQVAVSNKNKNQLFLRNMPRDTTKQEMTNVLQAVVTSPVKDVVLIREKPNPTSAKDLDMYKRRIMSHIELLLGTKDGYEVQLRKPRDFDFTMTGTVTFQDSAQAELLTNLAGYEELSICNQQVHFDIQLQRLYYIDKEIYAVVGDELETEVNDIRTKFHEDVVIDEQHLANGTVSLRLKSSSKENFTESAMRLNILIEGTNIDLTDVQHQRFAMSTKGKRALQETMRQEGVFLKYGRWRGSISVFGPVAAVGAAVESVKKVLTELQQVKVQEIELAGDDRPFGVMRELFIRYGISMKQFIEECALTDVDISVKRHTMSVFGNVDAIEKAKSVVDSVVDQLRDKPVQARVEAEACPVCLCDLDDETYRTELCGHSYCRSCIDGMLHHGIKSKDLPLVCTKENCDKPLVLQDIYNLVGKSKEALKPLVDAATEKFVSDNSKEYQFCITPNCPVVYKITKQKSKFTCPNERCRIEVCTACKARYHEGFSCDVYRGIKSQDFGLAVWIKQSPRNRAICPKCTVPIETNGGCKHVLCKCGAHICWKCKKTFPNELATHNHLARDCGGI